LVDIIELVLEMSRKVSQPINKSISYVLRYELKSFYLFLRLLKFKEIKDRLLEFLTIFSLNLVFGFLDSNAKNFDSAALKRIRCFGE
jgi:hypothetical protein